MDEFLLSIFLHFLVYSWRAICLGYLVGVVPWSFCFSSFCLPLGASRFEGGDRGRWKA